MTATTGPAAKPAAPRRIVLNEHTAYELTAVAPTGVTLHLFEATHDAAVFLTMGDAAQLRAELASMLLDLGGAAPGPSLISPAGQVIAEQLRQCFVALMELDKANGAEVTEIASWLIRHVRSWRPFVLRADGGAL